MDIAIKASGVSKSYLIGSSRDEHDALRHVVERFLRNPFTETWRKINVNRSADESFWALRDVSFEVNQGDVVAVIGRNGAGKSTLLKLLSRITSPTTGKIVLNGRVASLLEVGTGFHQELTGRENIFLNGAILGMSSREIRAKFDEIVDFSEIGQFLDTPVKRYSSGMYVRLAFSVAAHLEPEILIVDEVLAVGDAAFQKKCLGKIGQVAKNGRTVLFVSHNMSAVQALCSRAIYLKKGSVSAIGAVDEIVGKYVDDTQSDVGQRFSAPRALGDSLILREYDIGPETIQSGAGIPFKILLEATQRTTLSELQILIYNNQALRLAMVDFRPYCLPVILEVGERFLVEGNVQTVPFVEGDYRFGLYLNAGTYLDNYFDLTVLSVATKPVKKGVAPYPLMYRGYVELPFSIDTYRKIVKGSE